VQDAQSTLCSDFAASNDVDPRKVDLAFSQMSGPNELGPALWNFSIIPIVRFADLLPIPAGSDAHWELCQG